MATVFDPTSGQYIDDTNSFAGQTNTGTTQDSNAATTPAATPPNISPPAAPQGNTFRIGSGDYQAPPSINLSDPNQLALTGLTAAQRTTPQYNPVIGDETAVQYHGRGEGTAAEEATHTYQTQALNPTIWQREHGELQFDYNPIRDGADTTLSPSQYQSVGTNLNTDAATTSSGGSYNIPTPGFTAPGFIDPSLYGSAQGNVNPYSLYNSTNATAAQGQVAQGSTYDAAQGATVNGQVDPRSMTQNQFSELTNGVLDGNVPDWARTAVTAARQQANASGLGNSTMALGATTAAIFNVALPMAQFNAGVIAQVNQQNIQNAQAMIQFNTAATNAARQYNAGVVNQLNLANLQNAQQANMANAAFANDSSKYNASVQAQLNLQNLQNAQQTLLSNQAAENAAKQYNAQTATQNQQFFASLASSIQTQNANRAASVDQFNAGQANSMAQFNTNLNSQRQEFNAQNGLIIDQSNVQWRRTINTANTAGANAAAQANVQNAFNLSTTAQNQLWNQARDEASWALTSGENSQNRLLSLVNSALNRQTSLQILASQLNANTFSQLGGLAANLLGGSGGLGSLGKLFDSGSQSDSGSGNGGDFGGGGDFGSTDFASDIGGGDFGGGGDFSFG